MHYLVDAYNLLFRYLKKCGPLENTRQKFIKELNSIISTTTLHVTLVFDGAEQHFPHASRKHFDALELIYTSKKQSADEYISEAVASSISPSQIIVVTNDKELARRCKMHRAKILTIDEFLDLLIKKKHKEKKSKIIEKGNFKDSDSQIARLLILFEKRMRENPSEELD